MSDLEKLPIPLLTYIFLRAVISGGTPEIRGDLLTLFQSEGADYAHHINASTPGFENLRTSLF